MTRKTKRARRRSAPPRFLPYLSDSPETRARELARFREYARGRVRAVPAPKAPPAPRAPRERDSERLYSDEKAACLRFGRDFFADRGSYDEGDEGEPVRVDGYASDLAEAALFSVRKRPIGAGRPGTFLNSLAADFVAEGFYSEARKRSARKEKKRSAA
jgi:hypothetical protein